MPQLTPSQVHIDQPLTNLTIAYLQDESGFIANQVFPQVPVANKTDKYYIYDRENFLRNDVKSLAPGVETENTGMSISTDTYSVDVRGLGTTLDFQTLANEDTMLDIRSAQAKMLAHKLLIDRESRWMSTYFATGIWDTEYTGVANASNNTASEVTQWDDYTNSTPIIDVTTARRAAMLASGGFMPNVMVVTRDVHDTLVNHPDILDRIDGGATTVNPAQVTRQMLASVFEVSQYLISDAIQNTAAEGVAESLSFISSKKAALYYAPPAPGLMVPAAGYNFTWSSLDNSSGYGITVNSYQNDYLRMKNIAEKIDVIMAYDQKVVSSEMGVFFNTVIS